MSLQESGEMYLETILVLGQRTGFVRAIDICDEMGYSKPSISRAVGILRQDGYILVGKDGGITLTDAGRAIAEKIYERHCFFTEQLIAAGVDPETAEADACRIEHIISDESFSRLKEAAEQEQN